MAMGKKDIQVGKVYFNRGAGLTKRRVLDIGAHCRPSHYFNGGWGDPPNEDGVLFENLKDGTQDRLYLRSFAAWAGGIIEE